MQFLHELKRKKPMADTSATFIDHDGGPYPGSPYDQVRLRYRGPSKPGGIRITSSMAARLDWTHDGSDDDIVAYEVTYASP